MMVVMKIKMKYGMGLLDTRGLLGTCTCLLSEGPWDIAASAIAIALPFWCFHFSSVSPKFTVGSSIRLRMDGLLVQP